MTRNTLCIAVLCVTAAARGENLLKNPSFETAADGRPAGWTWRPDRAKAAVRIDSRRKRSGKASVCITNSAPQAPHVYSQLTQTVRVERGKAYTVSCYVWTRDGGTVWIGAGEKWQFRFPFPKKTRDWQRVTGTFRADADTVTVRILTESPTPGVWVDDVQLEPGEKATPFLYESPLEPGECRLRVKPFEPSPNLVPNPSFELVDGVRPKHWMWDRRNTDAVMTVDESTAHSGRRSVKFTNSTRFHPQVYGWFGIVGGIPVEPSRTYTVSAYVRSESPGIAWIGGGQRWRIRCKVPNTHGAWQRIEMTFQTEADEKNFPFMIVTESPTKGVWVDDVRLEKGEQATPWVAEGDHTRPRLEIALAPRKTAVRRGRVIRAAWAPSRWPPERFTFIAGVLRFHADVWVPRPPPQLSIQVTVSTAAGRRVAERTETVATAGRSGLRVQAAAHVGDTPNTDLTVAVRVRGRGPQVLVENRRVFHAVTPAGIRARLDQVRDLRDQVRSAVEALEKRGVGAYARVTLTILDNFMPWIEQDLKNGVADRAWDTVTVLREMAGRELRNARAVLDGKRKGLAVPRYQTSPIRIDGPSFIATRRFPDGRTEQGPVFFVGYGHFAQVRNDVEKFPGYGCNFIQIEFGPRSVLPAENKVSLGAVDAFLKVCDRAAKANVSVNLLLSPHYFPDWAYAEWPWLRDCHGGFFKYCVHAPESRGVLEKSLRTVIPRIGDNPALHSLCLSNEPVCTDLTGCRVSRTTWPQWLKKRHGSIERLNTAWGTAYERFDEIPIPPPKFTTGASIYDFVQFNQETFAGFHQWMADVIHAMAPDVPVHAKIMMSAHFGRSLHGVWSVSPELFGKLSQINGNDACCWYNRHGKWASGGPGEAMAYDFQRSMADKPVFNSENHIIIDRDMDVIPPEHVYATLWQGALHGLSATTIWVWERSNSYTADTAGSILHRPDCVEAAGRACLDLNRLAPEMTALQRLQPRIVFLWSLASVVQGETHARALTTAYRAADCLGVSLGLVTERQLARYAKGEPVRPLRNAPVLVTTEVTHLPDAALAGLRRFARQGGRIVTLGNCFGADEYGHARAPAPTDLGEKLDAPVDDDAALFAEFAGRLVPWGTQPVARVTGTDGGAVFGVESRTAVIHGRRILNACNYLRTPQTVHLRFRGRPVAGARNLITGERVSSPLVLPSLVPVLLDLGADPGND